MKVFYSWQSDLPSSRALIRRALNEAVTRIAAALDVEEAERPELDEATKGSRGMADIAEAILEKIAACAVYVADVTPIVRSETGRYVPNPNVMYELGWASKSPGFERIIGVMNTFGNEGPNCLPFDIRKRRILTFHYDPDAAAPERQRAQAALTKDLQGAIAANLTELIGQKAEGTLISGTDEAPSDFSIWSGAGTIDTTGDAFGRSTSVAIQSGARCFLRVIPARWPSGAPTVFEMHDREPKLYSRLVRGGSFDICSEGFATYGFANSESATADSVLMQFASTGEFWFVDSTAFWTRDGEVRCARARVLKHWSLMLPKLHARLDELGASNTRRVIAGANNLKGVRTYGELGASWTSVRAGLKHERTSTDWSQKSSETFLLSAYNKFLEAFGIRPIAEADYGAVISSA